MLLEHFFDKATATLTYLVADEATGEAAVIDPLMDYDPRSGRTSWASCEAIARIVDARGLSLRWALETHVHADHLSGTAFFRDRYGARTVAARDIGVVQRTFRDLYHLGPDFPVDGSQFDRLVGDGETLALGPLGIRVLGTPGHAPAHLCFQVNDVVFLGDTLFAPDYGTARCDFPGGSAELLYDSIRRLYDLPDETRLLLGHDYRPGDRPLRWETTVAEQKERNVHLDARTTKRDFAALRRRRDAELEMPLLILPAMQVNIRAGRLPEPEANGVAYLKIPLNAL